MRREGVEQSARRQIIAAVAQVDDGLRFVFAHILVEWKTRAVRFGLGAIHHRTDTNRCSPRPNITADGSAFSAKPVQSEGRENIDLHVIEDFDRRLFSDDRGQGNAAVGRRHIKIRAGCREP